MTFECALDGAAFDRRARCRPTSPTWPTASTRCWSARSTRTTTSTPTPASYTWTVDADTTPPVTQILDGPDATTTLVDAGFGFTSEQGATFECSLDGEPFASCSSPVEYSGLALGDHVFRVRATDARGNVETPVSLRVDDRARHDAARDDAARQAAGHHARHGRDLQLLLQRAGRRVRVRARRRAVRGLREPDAATRT